MQQISSQEDLIGDDHKHGQHHPHADDEEVQLRRGSGRTVGEGSRTLHGHDFGEGCPIDDDAEEEDGGIVGDCQHALVNLVRVKNKNIIENIF